MNSSYGHFDTSMGYNFTDNLQNRNNNIKFESNQRLLTKGELCDDELSHIFYSDENVARVQKLLKQEVFLRTKGQFRLDEDQDENDILVVMKSVFDEYAKHLPYKIIHQVKALNKKTIEAIIPGVITNVKQTHAYLQEINGPIKPIDRPVNVNHAGRRTLPSVTTIWNTNTASENSDRKFNGIQMNYTNLKN